MVASNKSFEPIYNQPKLTQNQIYSPNHGSVQFLAYSDMLGIKKYVLELGNSMVASNRSKNQS